MRLFVTFIFIGAMAVSQAFANDELGSAVNTDDICEARPDICGTSHKRTKKKRVRSTNSVKKKKKAEAQNVNDEAFNDFFSDELEESPKPKKETMANPPPVQQASATPRQPASSEPRAERRRISFSDYMNANANHPVLNMHRKQFQDAFPNVNRPAAFTATTAPETQPSTPPATPATPVSTPPVDGGASKDYVPPPTTPSDMATGN